VTGGGGELAHASAPATVERQRHPHAHRRDPATILDADIGMNDRSGSMAATKTREAVLDAALALFDERGYDATPVPAIAARAGVAVGSLYRAFPSKEALVNELYREGKRRLAACLPGEAELRVLDPRAGFGRWCDGLWRFHAANPAWSRFLEVHHHDPHLDDESRAAARALDAAAERFVRRAQRAGALRDGPPAELVALVLGAFTGLVRAGLAHPRRRAGVEDALWCLLARPR
jgi:AcrR family transcriptional regulator